MVDAGGGAEGEGAGPGGDEPLRVGVRDPGVAPVRPRPVVVELAHPPPLSLEPNLLLPLRRRLRTLRNEIDGWGWGFAGEGKNGYTELGPPGCLECWWT